MIDLIGDIHGHADELKALLKKLGYNKKGKVFKHSERKVLFIGDYIDRGPKIPETLEIVRSMVEGGNAIALMGNHEYNALCFHQKETSGGHVRPHYIKNVIQHFKTLEQFQNRQKEYDDYIEWFKTLPLFYETKEFRAVHACWDPDHIKYLTKLLTGGKLTEDLLYQSAKKETKLHLAIEETLKGKEIQLPKEQRYVDKDGTERQEMRIRWWENPKKATYRSLSVLEDKYLPETPVRIPKGSSSGFYTDDEKPVFFGHYWLQGKPSLFKPNVCCLDYSVAKKGYLVAYRFDGEKTLSSKKMVKV